MKLERGMIVADDMFWYTVVDVFYDKEHGMTQLFCICDHANNRHFFDVREINHYLSRKEIVTCGWPDRIPKELRERGKPLGEIAEIMLGREDDRFDDYWGDE